MSIQRRQGYKYLAIWLNEGAKKPDKIIVLCKPLFESPSVGNLVLRGKNHENKTGLLFGGEPIKLEQFVKDIEKIENKLADKQFDFIGKFLKKLADRHDLALFYEQNT